MTKQDSSLCPICGKPLPQLPYELKDGVICRECEQYLRFMYPLQYVKNLSDGKPDLSNILPELDLKPRERADLVEEFRHVPLNRRQEDPPSSLTVDRMHGVTVEEFSRMEQSADRLRDQARSYYQDYDNVCTVSAVSTIGKLEDQKGLANVLLYYGKTVMIGTLLLGRLCPGDMVTVLSKGRTWYADVMLVNYTYTSSPQELVPYMTDAAQHDRTLSKVVEGQQVSLVLDTHGETLLPDDWLMMDD